MTRIGLYPGSFDPITNGHLDVIRRAGALVDRLVLAVGAHHGKTPLFSAEERCAMIEREAPAALSRSDTEIVVTTFKGLVIEAAQDCQAQVILRGLRDATDFDYEMQMAGTNAALAPEVDTVFLPASPGVRHVAASLVRQIAGMGGDVEAFVPPRVAGALRARFSESQQ